MNPEQIRKKILDDNQEFFSYIPPEELENYSKMDVIVNEFSRNEHTLKLIFDNINYRILAVSDNLEELSGYTKEDFKKNNILLYLKAFHFDHLLSPIITGKWIVDMYKKLMTQGGVDFNNIQTTICGIKLKRKNGEVARSLQRYITLETTETGYGKFFLVTGEDIKHLMKGDFYWLRMSYGDLPSEKFYYSSADKKNYDGDIVSEREKDVLRLIAEGFESKEIAEKLFLSVHTVDNHRRNAINRTGARDTTALIQICRMCGIL